MLNRLRSLDAIDAPFALGERILPPAPVAAIAPKAVADWTRATVADILTDAERGALAEAFPVPKCIAKPAVDMRDSAPAIRFPVISKTYEVDSYGNVTASGAVASHDSPPVENRQRCRIPAAECLVPVDLSSANDPELRAVAERMAVARQQADIRRAYGIGVGLASTEPAKVDADGWIEWCGDANGPALSSETPVRARLRDGRVVAGSVRFMATCGTNWWDYGDPNRSRDHDIVAYRVGLQ